MGLICVPAERISQDYLDKHSKNIILTVHKKKPKTPKSYTLSCLIKNPPYNKSDFQKIPKLRESRVLVIRQNFVETL